MARKHVDPAFRTDLFFAQGVAVRGYLNAAQTRRGTIRTLAPVRQQSAKLARATADVSTAAAAAAVCVGDSLRVSLLVEQWRDYTTSF